MSYLKGKQIPITVPMLKKLIGTKVNFLPTRDIDRSGRGNFYPRYGVITEIYRRHVDFGNGELLAFSQIAEIAEFTLSKEVLTEKLTEAMNEFHKKGETLAFMFFKILLAALKIDYTCQDGDIAVELSKALLTHEGKKNYELFSELYDPQTSLVRFIIDLRFAEEHPNLLPDLSITK